MAPISGHIISLTAIGMAIASYVIVRLIYNIAFHPLRKFPGPLLWRLSRLPFLFHMLKGDLTHKVKSFHDKYGNCVRVAPDELSFLDGWKDIYTKEYLDRPPQWRIPQPGVGAWDLINSTTTTHARFRKAILPGFSKNSTIEQYPLVDHYGSLLIQKLRKMTLKSDNPGSAVLNLVEWISYAAFDLTSDLGWGRNLNCLETGVYQPWMTILTQYRAVLIAVACNYFPPLNRLLNILTPPSALEALNTVIAIARENVQFRLTNPVDRADLMTPILKHNKASPERSLSIAEIMSNSTLFVIGGTEPITLALSGTMHELLANPACMQRLCDEIRSSFASGDDITAASSDKLRYLTAVLKEGMRMFPPFPDGLRRVLKPGGATISGVFVPGSTTVSSSCLCTFSSEEFFGEPEVFAPTRWLLEEKDDGEWVGEDADRFAKDRRDLYYPFALGPRNCPGQHLAWSGLRVVLAKLLWEFDVRLAPGTSLVDARDQKIFWHWEHRKLEVEISQR